MGRGWRGLGLGIGVGSRLLMAAPAWSRQAGALPLPRFRRQEQQRPITNVHVGALATARPPIAT